MWRQALRELRHRPSRLIGTLAAIVLSVAFLAGILVFVETEGQALAKGQSLTTSRADLVVSAGWVGEHPTFAPVQQVLAAAPGVDAVESFTPGYGMVSAGAHKDYASLTPIPQDERLRWFTLASGRLPAAAGEVALPESSARDWGLSVGHTMVVNRVQSTVVGLMRQPRTSGPMVYLPSGTTAGEAAPALVVVLLHPGTSAADATAALRDRLATSGLAQDVEIRTAAAYQAEQVNSLARGLDVMRTMLLAFGGIALLTGGIIIANTFAIVVASRRRSIGLLRALGASKAQTGRALVLEALCIGLIGSTLGAALGVGAGAAAAALTGSLSWGLVVPWSGLALTALGGSLLTVVCSLWPVRRALAVAPLEALSPTLSAPTTRRLSLARIIVCGLVGVAGGALVALGVSRGEMLASVGGAALVSVAVLVGTPLFVPPLVGALGRLAARRGIGRVAAANIVRDPGRSSVTAAALAMTVGLVVTILVGGASAKTTFLGELERNYPVDVAVYSAPPVDFVDTLAALPADLPATLGAIDGVAASATLPGVQGTVAEYRGTPIYGMSDSAKALLPPGFKLADNEILYNENERGFKPGPLVTTYNGVTVTLTGRPSAVPTQGSFIVTSATLARLAPSAPLLGCWLSVPDRSKSAAVVSAVIEATASTSVSAEGGVIFANMLEQILQVMLLTVTGLLGVAALIALIGVGNTLGLSVMERTRENALLRALGVQRSGLRLMLLIEALLLATVASALGVLAGIGFGLAGAATVAKASRITEIRLSVDWGQIAGFVAIVLVAAALASVLPARRAVRAAPIEALSDE